MKRTIFIFFIFMLLAVGCRKKETTGIPGTLEGKKELLTKKKQELMQLENLIRKLEQQIDSLQPGIKKRTLVTVMEVKKDVFKRYTEVQGVVQSGEVVKVSSEIPGRLLNVFVENGDRVPKGKLLAKIDVSTLKKKMEELQTSLQLATEVYERQKRLWDKNIGSEIQYLRAKNNKERLEKGLESLRLQLQKANIYAPASGVIDRKSVEAGEMVAPGFPLMMILNTNRLKVTAGVPENYLPYVHKGDMVKIKFPALSKEMQGKISLTGSTIDPTNRTFAIEIKLNNSHNLLKPNLLAIVLINDYTKEDAIVIPAQLVQYEISGKAYVMVARKQNGEYIAKKVYVDTGQEYDGKTVIESGLQEGDLLIVDGARSVSDNEKIEITQAK